MGFRFDLVTAMVVFPLPFQIPSLGPSVGRPREMEKVAWLLLFPQSVRGKDSLPILVVPVSAGRSSLELDLFLGRVSDFARCRNRFVIVAGFDPCPRIAAGLADSLGLGCCSFFAAAAGLALGLEVFLSEDASGAQFSFLPSLNWTSPLRSQDRVGAPIHNAIAHRPDLLVPLLSLDPCPRVLPASGQY